MPSKYCAVPFWELWWEKKECMVSVFLNPFYQRNAPNKARNMTVLLVDALWLQAFLCSNKIFPELNQKEGTRGDRVISLLWPLSFQSNHYNEQTSLQGHNTMDRPRTAHEIQRIGGEISKIKVSKDNNICRMEWLGLAVYHDLCRTGSVQCVCSVKLWGRTVSRGEDPSYHIQTESSLA